MAFVETKVDDRLTVSPQIDLADLPTLAAAGYRTVINNRPDGEDPDQPSGAEVAEAAAAAGLAYLSVPLANGALSPDHIVATQDALASMTGPAVAYCRSGTRSYVLYALATSVTPADLLGKVQDAATKGYDISGAMAATAWL